MTVFCFLALLILIINILHLALPPREAAMVSCNDIIFIAISRKYKKIKNACKHIIIIYALRDPPMYTQAHCVYQA